MVNMSAIRPSGRTYTLDLTTSASAALLVEATTNDQTNYVSLLNTGNGVAAIEMGTESSTVKTPAIASTGNAGSFVLPASMNFPLIIAAPKAPFYIKGISSGTNTLYITAVQAD
jgi:uncharacterized protein YfdQ (DUF2303 family)